MTPVSSYNSLVFQIIKYQESIIGPMAWNEASKVAGLQVKGAEVSIVGDGKKVLEGVVRQYETLFGGASVEACKDAVRPLLAKAKVDLPAVLL